MASPAKTSQDEPAFERSLDVAVELLEKELPSENELRRARTRHDFALDLLDLVNASTTVIDAVHYEKEATGVFVSHSDKTWSVADYASFACMSERRTRYALSFDGDFAKTQAEFRFNTLGVSVA